jgi:two-component system, LytTR family, response regulator LytT
MDRKPRRNNEFMDVSGDEVILVERAGHLVPVARSRVQWAHAKGDYVRLHVPGESYLVRRPLEYLAERWAEHGFVCIHRAYLVFFPLVTDVWRGPSGYNVRLGSGRDAVDIPVSRRHEKQVKQLWIHQCQYHGNETPPTT